MEILEIPIQCKIQANQLYPVLQYLVLSIEAYQSPWGNLRQPSTQTRAMVMEKQSFQTQAVTQPLNLIFLKIPATQALCAIRISTAVIHGVSCTPPIHSNRYLQFFLLSFQCQARFKGLFSGMVFYEVLFLSTSVSFCGCILVCNLHPNLCGKRPSFVYFNGSYQIYFDSCSPTTQSLGRLVTSNKFSLSHLN